MEFHHRRAELAYWAPNADLGTDAGGDLIEVRSLPPMAAGQFRTVYVPHDDARPLVWDAYVDGRGDICSPDGTSLTRGAR